MNDTNLDGKRRRTRVLLASIAALAVVVGVFWWLGTRETEVEKQIARELDRLRLAGEPVDAAGMEKLFPNPPPERDAGLLLTNFLLFAAQNPAPSDTPIIISGTTVPRTESFRDPVMIKLRAYRETTADIWKTWPVPWPTGAVFASHYELGMMSNTMPKLIQVRHLAQMMATLAMTAAEDGDAATATDMLERGFQLSQTLPSDSLVMHMIGRAVANLNTATAERCLNRTPFSDEQLRRISVATSLANTSQFADALRGEHCLAIWAFEALRAGRKPTEVLPHIAHKQWWKRAWQDFEFWLNAYRDEDYLHYLKMYDASQKTRQPPALKAIADFRLLARRYESNVVSRMGEGVPANWARAAQADFEIEARLTILETVLAIERFRLAQNGRLPDSLEELSPHFLAAPPKDVFDLQPLRYKELPGGYVVYSIGEDGRDDGGLEKTNNAAKYDVTFTVER